MDENWCALLISIFKICSPELAFEKLYNPKASRIELTERDIKYAIYLRRKGESWREIGEVFGTTGDTIKHRIFRHLNKAN